MRCLARIVFIIFLTLNQLWSSELAQTGYQYLFPKPDARFVSRQASLLIRFANESPGQLANLGHFVIVSGSKSGLISGTTSLVSDGKTVCFRPALEFSPGETVQVELKPEWRRPVKQEITAMRYSFKIISEEIATSTAWTPAQSATSPNVVKKRDGACATMTAGGMSIPSDFPELEITINNNPDPGYIFMNLNINSPYSIILDNSGAPVWYRRMPYDRRDFKVQKDGTISMVGNGFTGYDQNFNQLKTYRAVSGYNTDDHELQVLENGDYFLIGFRDIIVDMSQLIAGGKKDARVYETCIQGFTPNGELTFLWPALDHFDPNELIGYTVPGDEPTNNSFRFTHMNAIDIDDDGHILLSSRHLSQITKINRETGEIIWRLGGAKNDFTFINDPLQGPRNQHDIRNLGNGHYSVFDNGNTHSPARSRGVEWVLDTDKKTATLVWEYRNPQGTNYSHYMGNCQRLPNGNTLINWALRERPRVSEISSTGEVEFELWSPGPNDCYRIFRFPWTGMEEVPYLILEPGVNSITLLCNKFGDATVEYYRIYGGLSPNPSTVLDTCRTTLKVIRDLEKNKLHYFRVKAVHKDGSESDYSNEERAKIIDIEPNVNFVLNGDFGEQIQNWTWEVSGSAAANWNVADGVLHCIITSPGNSVYEIQLRQNGMPLIKGQDYLFEFDAWADANRTIEAKVGQDVSPHTNYSRIGLSALTTRKKHFSYSFRMQEPSDFDARVVINCGTSVHDVYIDNISLKLVGETNVLDDQIHKPTAFRLDPNYPNPFNNETTISFQLPTAAHVQLAIYNITGQKLADIVDDHFAAGIHRVCFDASDYASGIYLYQLSGSSHSGAPLFYAVKKMALIK